MRILIAIVAVLCINGSASAHHYRHHQYHVAAPPTFCLFDLCKSPDQDRLGRHRRVLVPGASYHPVEASRGLVRARSGATATVAASAQGHFQCVVDALESQGYPVRFMGGLSAGHMRNSLHHAGLALDINQTSRNRTTPHMPSNEVALANACGLISGAQWANGDSGHFQLGGYGGGRHHRRRR